MSEQFRALPPQEDLKKRIHYDPETGLISRLTGGHNLNVPQSFGEQISIGGRRYITARIIWKYMTGVDPRGLIDHRNRLGWDHRWENLREATRSQNNFNVSRRKDNSTGITGVHKYQWNETKWIAHIRKNTKGIRSPIFDTLEEAIDWRTRMEEELFGEFSDE